MQNSDKSGLIQFVDMITNKGWINANTGNGWRAAVAKILANTPGDTDVARIDVKMSVLQYNNLHPGELSPPTLNQYEKRISAAILQYLSYLDDPTKYKAPARPPANGKTEKPKAEKPKGSKAAEAALALATPAQPEAPKPEHEHERSQRGTGIATESNLMLPFPLRPNYLAQIIIPRDMSKDEAERLCAFIQTLAMATSAVPVTAEKPRG